LQIAKTRRTARAIGGPAARPVFPFQRHLWIALQDRRPCGLHDQFNINSIGYHDPLLNGGSGESDFRLRRNIFFGKIMAKKRFFGGLVQLPEH
jgi:hypothetical protein